MDFIFSDFSEKQSEKNKENKNKNKTKKQKEIKKNATELKKMVEHKGFFT